MVWLPLFSFYKPINSRWGLGDEDAMSRYSFSGHESFLCKAQWLKKGYDFVHEGNSFNDADAVVKLGVGKNMVASIRFWLKSFGLTQNDKLNDIATYLFDEEKGMDPYAEDTFTLWLLHYLLLYTDTASLYRLLFVDFQREKREFDKDQVVNFVRRKCSVPEQKNVFNENTVKKDVGVLLRSYLRPDNLKSIEDFSAILLPLDLIKHRKEIGTTTRDVYSFAIIEARVVPSEILLYAFATYRGEDRTLSNDKLQDLAFMFCMPIEQFLIATRELASTHPELISYTDNAGIRNVQFLKDIDEFDILDQHYRIL